MSCKGNKGHSKCNTEEREERRRRVAISTANFSSTFVSSTTSKFHPRFINGCNIDVDEGGCGIELKRNWVYLISYSYTLETEKCGVLEVTPMLNREKIEEGISRASNAREGKVMVSNSFTLATDCATTLTFRYCAIDAETGKRPRGQVSIVSLGRFCGERGREEHETDCDKDERCFRETEELQDDGRYLMEL